MAQNKLPFTNLYNIKADELTKLSNFRFDKLPIYGKDGVNWVDNPNDPAKYIMSLYRIPYNIDGKVHIPDPEPDPDPDPDPEPEPVELDYEYLIDKVDEIALLTGSDYTPTTWLLLDEKIDHAHNVIDDTLTNKFGEPIKITQDIINNSLLDIISAFNKLELIPVIDESLITVEKMIIKYDELEEFTNDKDNELLYSPDTWNSLTSLIIYDNYKIAHDLVTNKYGQLIPVTQEERDTLYNSLVNAFNNLETYIEPNTVLLQDEINKFDSLEENLYEVPSWKNYVTVLNQAKSIINEPIKTQLEVDTVLTDLITAFDDLVLKRVVDFVPPTTIKNLIPNFSGSKPRETLDHFIADESYNDGVFKDIHVARIQFNIFGLFNEIIKFHYQHEEVKPFDTVVFGMNLKAESNVPPNYKKKLLMDGNEPRTIEIHNGLFFLWQGQADKNGHVHFEFDVREHTTLNKVINMLLPFCANLTTMFGKGNEPPFQETYILMDKNFDFYYIHEGVSDFEYNVKWFPKKSNFSMFRNEPLNIPEGNLILGDIVAPIKADVINDYIYTVDLGNIFIDNHLSKTVGFKNVEIELHIPNFTKMILDVDKVLGNTINLMLKVNVITGKGTLNIYNSETNAVMYTQTEQIGEKIPYEILGVHLDIGTGVIETDYNIPYVEIKTLVPDNEVTLNKVSAIHLSTNYDYLKDDDTIELQTYATEREQHLIKQAIYQGVFIRT